MTNTRQDSSEPDAPASALQKIVFLSRERAERLRPEPGSVIVSIHDASEPPAHLRDAWAERLTLKFHDTLDEEGVLTPYKEEDARKVLDLVVRRRNTAPVLYVHCRHGQSRSAGIALALAGILNLPCFRRKGAKERGNFLELVDRKSWPYLNHAVYKQTVRTAMEHYMDEFF